MRYHVVADPVTVLGFSLAGVRGTTVSDEAQTLEAVQAAINDPDIGVLIITERAAQSVRALVDQHTFSELLPLIVEIPDREGPLKERRTLKQLVHQAIGITV